MGGRLRILHVEDEAIYAMEMKLELESSGYEALPHVSTGEAAVASARRERPDLILMDIRLAGKIDGIEAAEKIMAERATPLIFLTGYEDREIRDRADRVHPLGFLVKPQSMKVIKAIIEAARAPEGATMEPVRWGIMSVSGIYGQRLHQPLSHMAEARVAAIASRGKERAAAAAAKLGIPKSYGSYAELLADPEIEAVYIPLPNDLHAEWTLAALEAGKHVLCEKPLAMDAAQGRTMAAKAKEKGLLLMEAFMYRFHPQWARAREIIATGELGRLRAIHAWFSYNNADPTNIRNKTENGGGALYDIGCYAISSARFLAAAASPGAEPERGLYIAERDAAFGTDSLGTGLLDFGQNGPRASFHISTRAFPVQRVEVMGERGSLAVILPFNAYEDVPLGLEVTTGLGTRRIEAGPANQYSLMLSAFSKAVRAKAPAPTPVEDGIANMAAIDALFRSEKSGTWERI